MGKSFSNCFSVKNLPTEKSAYLESRHSVISNYKLETSFVQYELEIEDLFILDRYCP